MKILETTHYKTFNYLDQALSRNIRDKWGFSVEETLFFCTK